MQAVSFAGPSENYGEEVYAVVVPKDGATLDPEEVRFNGRKRSTPQHRAANDAKDFDGTWQVRKYVGTKLAPMKVPTMVFVADDVPRTATGKIQRRIVAEVYVDEIKARTAKPKL